MKITQLRQAYAQHQLTPEGLMQQIRQRAEDYADHHIWIHLFSAAEQQPWLAALADKDPATHPLWGVPFAIKDNIDLVGFATTVACPEFAYTPSHSAPVVQRLLDAGAIPVGKCNLDQFATGLNGTRSPYGACRNAFHPDYLSGGSSSGSAVAVALGLALFALGTDTAGSGRVPAAFNNLIGLKPSRGLVPTTGVVPACRSLDCLSIFSLDTDDAHTVLSCIEGVEADDPYSRPNPFENNARHYGCYTGALRLGHLRSEHLNFFGDDTYRAAYDKTVQTLDETLDIEWVEVDYTPFNDVARLLYDGPWVAERYLTCQTLIEQKPEALHPVVRDIIAGGAQLSAADSFRAQYHLEALRRQCARVLDDLDALLTPTAGALFRIDALLDAPIELNNQLGYYTNFVNLLDLAAIALPTTLTEAGLPFGITLSAPAFQDRTLLSIAHRMQRVLELPCGVEAATGVRAAGSHDAQPLCVGPSRWIDVLVCGAHLEGLPLNWQLSERGAQLKMRTHTAPCYRLYALPGGPPYRPGMVLDERDGAAIEVEVWRVPSAHFGSFVAAIPAPLGIGKVRLADGAQVSGFICEPWGLEGAEEITALGGWRAYLAQRF